MVYDFMVTIPVTPAKREQMIWHFADTPSLPVRARFCGLPVDLYMIKGADGNAITVAGHFVQRGVDQLGHIIELSDEL